MTKTPRARYTLAFKQEAVHLVENRQSTAAVARTQGVVDQTLFKWVKAYRQGKLTGADRKAPVRVEQIEISRLRAALVRGRVQVSLGQTCRATVAQWQGQGQPVRQWHLQGRAQGVRQHQLHAPA